MQTSCVLWDVNSTAHETLRSRLLVRAGLSELRAPFQAVTWDELYRSEWSPEFERLQRNRLVMGALRYGRIGAGNKPTYDRVGSMVRRLQKYRETGNTEFLVDVANLCLLEFVEGQHPNKHFHAVDGDKREGVTSK